jgi:F-type H+-transporting ATPase subunit gamma
MAGGKEIRTKIKSIQNTQKITRAMEMVAASKMRRSQERMVAARPYSDKIWNVIQHLAHAHPEYRHPVLEGREEVKRVGYIVLSSDRGLCGGLNSNLFRIVLQSMKEWSDKGVEIDIVTVGTKAFGFFKRIGGNIVAEVSHLGDKPGVEQVIGPMELMGTAFREGNIDRVYLACNEFVNTMTQKSQIIQIAPIDPEELEEEIKHHWDYIYEPDSVEIVDTLVRRYLEAILYRALVENVACEMAARMVAMKSASDNAKGIIEELQLVYNKARQAAITQEINEIVSGAAAL